jgi:hypothetical protein
MSEVRELTCGCILIRAEGRVTVERCSRHTTTERDVIVHTELELLMSMTGETSNVRH